MANYPIDPTNAAEPTDARTAGYAAEELRALKGYLQTLAPSNAGRSRNRFANGAFVFDQRNAGVAVTVNSGANFRCQDCWIASGQAADGVFTVAQQATGGPVGSPNYSRITVTTADASVGAGQPYLYSALIEGLDVADFEFGAANAQPMSISFWFRASVIGTYSGALRNDAGNRSYPYTWVYPVANVWQYVTIANIPGDVTGTWPTSNQRSMLLTFDLGCGDNFRAPANSWVGANACGANGSIRPISTGSSTYDIAQLQVELGTSSTPFEWVPYQAGLAKVQRYYERTYNVGTPNGSPTTVGAISIYSDNLPSAANRTVANTWQFKVSKRTTPTAVTFFGNSGVAGAVAMAGGNMTAILSFVSQNHAVVQATDTSTNGAAQIIFQAVAEAEL